jgi:hypothetical protein
MCIFAGPVRAVGATRIFARRDGGRQALVYEMTVDSAADNAMVLPLPAAPGARAEFVDLSAYPRFFADLDAAFPEVETLGAPEGGAAARTALAVERVGSFEASFVARAEDFGRLDPRFGLSAAVLEGLGSYTDYAFAVFRFAPGRRRVHPMALWFPTREPGLYFPTVHVHDGAVRPAAAFDHTLYAQGPAPDDWEASAGPLSGSMDPARAAGLVDPAACARRLDLDGLLENSDTRVPGRVPAAVRLLADVPTGGPVDALLRRLLEPDVAEVLLSKTDDGLAIEVRGARGALDRPPPPEATFTAALAEMRDTLAIVLDGGAGPTRYQALVAHGAALTRVVCEDRGRTLAFGKPVSDDGPRRRA